MQFLNAVSPIDVTDEGIVTEARLLQLKNAASPMDVTVFGIIIDARLEHPEKVP